MVTNTPDIYQQNTYMIKTFFVLIYTFLIKSLGFLILGVQFLDVQYVFYLMMVIMFLPEFMFIFAKSFRLWLKGGIENGDGKLNKSDFTSLLMNYSTLWCIRLYVLFGLLEAFYGIQVREAWINTSLVGAFGIKAMETISFFKKDKI
jgi:hypothetical protein